MLPKSLQTEAHIFSFLENWKGIREEEQSSSSAGHWKCVGHLWKKAAVSKEQAGCQVSYSFRWVLAVWWPLGGRGGWGEKNTPNLSNLFAVGGGLPVVQKQPPIQRKLPWQQDKIAHNPLDSTSPLVKKGKQREVPKAKKHTPLKKVSRLQVSIWFICIDCCKNLHVFLLFFF